MEERRNKFVIPPQPRGLVGLVVHPQPFLTVLGPEGGSRRPKSRKMKRGANVDENE